MEVLKRISEGHKFEVIRPFKMGREVTKRGDVVEIKDPVEQMGLCQQQKIKPILPPVAVYIALTEICLPGKIQKFEAKRMELIELKDSDALPLLLSGRIIPKSDSTWRPFNRRLKK